MHNFIQMIYQYEPQVEMVADVLFLFMAAERVRHSKHDKAILDTLEQHYGQTYIEPAEHKTLLLSAGIFLLAVLCLFLPGWSMVFTMGITLLNVLDWNLFWHLKQDALKIDAINPN